MTTHEKTLRIARETALLQILAEDAFSKCEWDNTRKIIEHFYAIAIAEHEREKAGTPRKESASSIRLQMILQLLDDPEHDFTSADMEYWDTLHDRVQAMAREKAGAQALRETVEKIARIAHCGGLVGMSEHDALVAIRKESLQFWRTVETVEQARAALRQQGGNV